MSAETSLSPKGLARYLRDIGKRQDVELLLIAAAGGLAILSSASEQASAGFLGRLTLIGSKTGQVMTQPATQHSTVTRRKRRNKKPSRV